MIERYFNTIQFHYHDNMTPVNLSQYYQRPANFKTEAVLDKIVLPKSFDNEQQKVVINDDLKKNTQENECNSSINIICLLFNIISIAFSRSN